MHGAWVPESLPGRELCTVGTIHKGYKRVSSEPPLCLSHHIFMGLLVTALFKSIYCLLGLFEDEMS